MPQNMFFHRLANILLKRSDYMPQPSQDDMAKLLMFTQEQAVKPMTQDELLRALAVSKLATETQRAEGALKVKNYKGNKSFRFQ